MRQAQMKIVYAAIYDMDKGGVHKPEFILAFYGLSVSDLSWTMAPVTERDARIMTEMHSRGEPTSGHHYILKALRRRGFDTDRYRATIFTNGDADQSYSRRVPREYIKRNIGDYYGPCF